MNVLRGQEALARARGGLLGAQGKLYNRNMKQKRTQHRRDEESTRYSKDEIKWVFEFGNLGERHIVVKFEDGNTFCSCGTAPHEHQHTSGLEYTDG